MKRIGFNLSDEDLEKYPAFNPADWVSKVGDIMAVLNKLCVEKKRKGVSHCFKHNI